VPAVKPTTADSTKPMPGVYTTGAPPEATCFCRAMAMPKPWKAASATVPKRVYMVILRRPASPSLRRFCQLGTTEPIICTTMDAEMYGTTPSANTEKRDSEPPENMLNMFSRPPPCSIRRVIASGLTPGTGMNEPSLKTTSAPITKKMR